MLSESPSASTELNASSTFQRPRVVSFRCNYFQLGKPHDHGPIAGKKTSIDLKSESNLFSQ